MERGLRTLIDRLFEHEAVLSRRSFVQLSTLLGISVVASSVSCSSGIDSSRIESVYSGICAEIQNRPLALYGVPQGDSSAELERAIITTAETATDFDWLKPGDRIFIKPASNSPHPFPATTHPAAIRAISRLLKDHGAGKILVGDQAGVQHVHPCIDKTRGSTREVMIKNGIFQAIKTGGAEPCLFEEAGYASYYPAEPPQGSHWKEAVFLPSILREMDHVVYLPRLSTHVLAGVTLSSKSAVGWLREDSRLELHRDAGTFYEKTAEINGIPEIQHKLRLVLTVGTSAQTTWGPDFGYDAVPEYGLIIASENLATHDLFATGYLNLLKRENTPSLQKGLEARPWGASIFNRGLVTLYWSPGQGIKTQHLHAASFRNAWLHPTNLRNMEIFGKPPERPLFINVGETVPPWLIEGLTRQVLI